MWGGAFQAHKKVYMKVLRHSRSREKAGVTEHEELFNPCLSQFGLLEKSAIDWVAYEQQIFISYVSAGWEVQDQDVAKYSVQSCCLVHR